MSPSGTPRASSRSRWAAWVSTSPCLTPKGMNLLQFTAQGQSGWGMQAPSQFPRDARDTSQGRGKPVLALGPTLEPAGSWSHHRPAPRGRTPDTSCEQRPEHPLPEAPSPSRGDVSTANGSILPRSSGTRCSPQHTPPPGGSAPGSQPKTGNPSGKETRAGGPLHPAPGPASCCTHRRQVGEHPTPSPQPPSSQPGKGSGCLVQCIGLLTPTWGPAGKSC